MVNRKTGEIRAKKRQTSVITDHILPFLAQNVCLPREILKSHRGLYHFARDHKRGEADDIVTYLVENAKLLGIVKRKPPSGKLDAILSLTTASGP